MEKCEPFSEEECWGLLATASVGQLGVVVDALPAVLPVQYYLDDRSIVLCLGANQVPRHVVEGTVVALSVDHLDLERWSGWSVHVVGCASLRHRDGWAPVDCSGDHGGRVAHLKPTVMSGSQLHLCPFLSAVEREAVSG